MLPRLFATVTTTLITASLLTTGCGPCYHDPLCDYERAAPTSTWLYGETIASNDLLRGADVLLVSGDLEVMDQTTSGSTSLYDMDVEQLGDHWVLSTYEGFETPYLGWHQFSLTEFGGSHQANLNLESADSSSYMADSAQTTDDCECEGTVNEVSLICCNDAEDCFWEWGVCQ